MPPISHFYWSLLSAAVFGLLGIVLMVLGFKVFDWITPGIDVERELTEKQNIAVALLMAAVVLGISAVVVAVIVS